MDNTQKTIKTFGEYINKVTGKTGYLDKYGGSLVGTLLILLAFFIIFSYYYVISRLKPIKADWLNQRCRPEVVPFAGLINAPPEESKFDFTSKNFMECTNDVLSKTIGYFLQPIYYVMNVITNLYAIVLKGIQAIRGVLAYIRIRIMGIVSDIFSRILGIMIPVQFMFIKLRDILAKSMGVLTTGLYTVMTAYLSMKSFVGAFLEIIVSWSYYFSRRHHSFMDPAVHLAGSSSYDGFIRGCRYPFSNSSCLACRTDFSDQL